MHSWVCVLQRGAGNEANLSHLRKFGKDCFPGNCKANDQGNCPIHCILKLFLREVGMNNYESSLHVSCGWMVGCRRQVSLKGRCFQ